MFKLCMMVFAIAVANVIIKQKHTKLLNNMFKLYMMVFPIAVANVIIKPKNRNLLENI